MRIFTFTTRTAGTTISAAHINDLQTAVNEISTELSNGIGSVNTTYRTLKLAASTTAAASLNIPTGTAPTTPASGDVWNASGDLRFYNGTATRGFAFLDGATFTGAVTATTIAATGTGTNLFDGQLIIDRTSTDPFIIRDDTPTNVMVVNTSAKRIDARNGAKIQLWSGDATGAAGTWDSATGNMAVTGTLDVTGNTTVLGTTVLGNTTADLVTINAPVNLMSVPSPPRPVIKASTSANTNSYSTQIVAGSLGTNTAFSLTQNTIFYVPIIFGHDGSADLITIVNVSTAVTASNAYIGIYDADGVNGLPGTRLYLSAAVATAAPTGAKTTPALSLSVLAGKLYYVAIADTGATVVVDGRTGTNQVFAGNTTTATGVFCSLSGGTIGTTPNFLPTSAATTFSVAQTYPLLTVRVN